MPEQTQVLRIKRQETPDSEPYYEEFEIPYLPNHNVISMLMEIRRNPVTRQGKRVAPVVFDATHSVQLPSAQAEGNGPAVSGGQPEFIPLLARAAVAAGVDGVFVEVHDNPKEAKSDGANALESTKLRGMLKELQAVKRALTEVHATP